MHADDRAERGGVDEGERDQHAPLAEAVDEPALHGRADPGAGGERARHHAGDRERAGLLAQVEDRCASALMPIGKRASSVAATSAATCGTRRTSA